MAAPLSTQEGIQLYRQTMAQSRQTPSGLPKMTIQGSTTYGDVVPNRAKAGDIIQFGERLDLQSPEISGLIQQGALAPFTDQGAIFTQAYTGATPQTPAAGMTQVSPGQNQAQVGPTQSLRSQEFTPQGTPFVPGPNPPTPKNPPNLQQQYDATTVLPEELKRYKENLKHQLKGLGIQNIPSNADLDYYARAFARGGYTAQDIANDWTEMQQGTMGQTIGKGRIVHPDVPRWHWIVGADQGGGGQIPQGVPPTGGEGSTGSLPGGMNAPQTETQRIASELNT